MQQHPVPQNVVGFQFKLIGDMTVKQFVFLAAGVLIGYFFFRQVEEPYFKWPLAIGCFGAGFMFAFMPYDDRPMDGWVTNFLKAVYGPTMFLWQKSLSIPEILQPSYRPISHSTIAVGGIAADKKTMQEYVESLPQNFLSALDLQEQTSLKQIQDSFKNEYGTIENQIDQEATDFSLTGVNNRSDQETNSSGLATVSSPTQKVFTIRSPSGTQRTIPSVGLIKIRPLGKKPMDKGVVEEKQAEDKTMASAVEGLAEETEQPQIIHAQKSKVVKNTPINKPLIADEKAQLLKIEELDNNEKIAMKAKMDDQKQQRSEKVEEYLLTLQGKLAKSLAEKQTLEEALQKAKQQASEKPKEDVVIPFETLSAEKKEITTVKFIPSQMAAQIGVPQPTIFNIISGIVKDQAGEILPDIFIEIKDNNGKTQRALKTNKLGQFSIATPLDNGIHTVHFEDPRGLLQFDIIEVTLDGKIFPAMEVKAKSQKDPEREKLRDALFGKQI